MLHIDIETYSSIDLRKTGAYKYAESEDFEILIVAYSLNGSEVEVYEWKNVPATFFKALLDPETVKVAHNAAFERICFAAVGYDIPPEQWRCSMIKSSYCGLPLSLKGVSVALKLGDKSKDSAGKALIRYFSMPCKPTKVNGGRTRNLPHHAPEKWQAYKDYCSQDVVAEMEIMDRLESVTIPKEEWQAYWLDQRINDVGVRIDLELANSAIKTHAYMMDVLKADMKRITGLDNPNSVQQLAKWIEQQTGEKVQSLAKASVLALHSEYQGTLVGDVLEMRLEAAKTSIKKYFAMLACACKDGRARGLFQFYGAGRTGRWAGRLIQLQNLPRNYIENLDEARHALIYLIPELFPIVFDGSDTISQLIRTALVPTEGSNFSIADFSAIEARVLAFISEENWRLEVFKGDGKIYEASASKMFGVPIETIGKGSDLRQKGKVAELALGYQGSVGALKAMGADKMGLSDEELKEIVSKWRRSNPMIKKFWKTVETMAVQTVKNRRKYKHKCGVIFRWNDSIKSLQIGLPSGRNLTYWRAELREGKYGDQVTYMGTDGITGKWVRLNTYGGKITENIVQAIARDLLLNSMKNLHEEGYKMVMHVHDEVVVETESETELDTVCNIMKITPLWAKDFPLDADGYNSAYYKKD